MSKYKIGDVVWFEYADDPEGVTLKDKATVVREVDKYGYYLVEGSSGGVFNIHEDRIDEGLTDRMKDYPNAGKED